MTKRDVGKSAFVDADAVGGNLGAEVVRIAQVAGDNRSARVVATRRAKNGTDVKIGYWVKAESLRIH